MAKTRSQSRRANEHAIQTSSRENNKKKSKSKTTVFKVPPEMQKCHIRLIRLDPKKINFLLNDEQSQPQFVDEKQPKKKYNFRSRSDLPVFSTEKPKKSLKQIVAISQSVLYTSKAMRIWETIKKEAKKNNVEIKCDQIVCARMSGHRPWPAKLESFQKNGILLKFFGTHEIGIVKRSEVIPYELCKEMLEQYLKVPICDLASKTLSYHMSFIKACTEIACIRDD